MRHDQPIDVVASSIQLPNFGDCFAYEVAKQHRCPLLYVGDDFTKTDIEAVL